MSGKKAVPYEQTKATMSEWVYKDPVKNSRNGLTLYIDQSKTQPTSIKVQLPKCRCPFGIADKKADAGEYSRRNLELSADDAGLQEWVANFDAQNIEQAHKHSKAWFKKSLSKEDLGELYRKALQVSTKDPTKYAPLLRLKVSESGKQQTQIFVVYTDPETGTEKYRRGSTKDLEGRNCHVVAQAEISGLWFVSKGFGPTLVATNLLVWPSTETDDQFAFHGFGNLEKGEDLPADTADEPAAKRHRGDASTAATDGGTVFGGDGAAIE